MRIARRLALLIGFVVISAVAAAEDAAPPPPAPAPKPPEPAAKPAPEPPTPVPAPNDPPAPPLPGPRGAQGGGLGAGLDPETRRRMREQMWPAATAEEWKKPCLIPWQRTWEDALAVSKETGKPILVCVNMDGEIASEHYAGVRYRSPEIAALYDSYVTVIASVYRHTPRDYDEQGRRVLCPRFGSVTCGEHIAMEAIAYDKFLDGKRIFPRHIGVETAGGVEKEMYDVYYTNDTASVFKAIRDGVAGRPPPPVIVRGDRPIVERVESRELSDRTAVETAYQRGDAAAKRSLLEAAERRPDAVPLDLLRLAVFGFDVEMSKIARRALAKTTSPEATDVIAEALRVPMDPAERAALIAALKRLGDASPKARVLAIVEQGLSAKSSAVDAKAWSEAREAAGAPAAESPRDGRALEAEREARETAARASPEDAEKRLALAEASLALAARAQERYETDPRRAGAEARLMYGDARKSAMQAATLGAKGWRVDAVLALAAYYTFDLAESYSRAEAAMKTLPPGDASWASMAVATVFAEGRVRAIKRAVRERRDPPPEWIADIHAAYSILLKHPLGTETHIAWHHDFLKGLGADAQATAVLRQGLARFPASAPLHDRFRDRVLTDSGPEGLEAAYDALRAESAKAIGGPEPAVLEWFSGYASVVAAENQRRAARFLPAIESYGRALTHYERYARRVLAENSGTDLADVPVVRESVDRVIALALAGRARVAFEVKDDDRALADIVGALEKSPSSVGTQDGAGMTPGDTANAILTRLESAKADEMAKRLRAALRKVDPKLLPSEEGE